MEIGKIEKIPLAAILECNINQFPSKSSVSPLIQCKYQLHLLTRWCRKKVDKEIHAKPMWLKIWMTLLAEPPANKIAKQRRKFPAGILVPGIYGWLNQTFSFSGHFGFWHLVVTTAIVPTSRLSIKGLSALQAWQNWKRRSSLEKNTICLHSVRRLPSCNLHKKEEHLRN